MIIYAVIESVIHGSEMRSPYVPFEHPVVYIKTKNGLNIKWFTDNDIHDFQKGFITCNLNENTNNCSQVHIKYISKKGFIKTAGLRIPTKKQFELLLKENNLPVNLNKN